MPSTFARARSRTGIATGALLLAATSFLAPPLAAQTPPAAPAAQNSPVDDFAKQYKVFKDALTDLPRKIDEANGQVQSNNDPASANDQLDSLRGIVSSVLGLVADNGPVASLG